MLARGPLRAREEGAVREELKPRAVYPRARVSACSPGVSYRLPSRASFTTTYTRGRRLPAGSRRHKKQKK